RRPGRGGERDDVPRLRACEYDHWRLARRQLRRVPRALGMTFTTRVRESVGTNEDVHASASKAVGLEDFGEQIYEEGLRLLLDDYANLSELTPEGNYLQRTFLRGG